MPLTTIKATANQGTEAAFQRPALHAFLLERCPRTASRYPIPAMRQLREEIAAAHPQRLT